MKYLWVETDMQEHFCVLITSISVYFGGTNKERHEHFSKHLICLTERVFIFRGTITVNVNVKKKKRKDFTTCQFLIHPPYSMSFSVGFIFHKLSIQSKCYYNFLINQPISDLHCSLLNKTSWNCVPTCIMMTIRTWWVPGTTLPALTASLPASASIPQVQAIIDWLNRLYAKLNSILFDLTSNWQFLQTNLRNPSLKITSRFKITHLKWYSRTI